MIQKNTRNAQGGGTIRHRSDGRWEARYTVGIDPGTGKQIQKSVYGQTQKDVRQRLSKVSTELDSGTYKDPCKMTVGQWLDIWSREYLGNVKPFTVRSYSDKIKNHIKPAIGAAKLDSLTALAIQGFYNSLGKQRGDTPPLSPKTIKNVHGVLHSALQQAVAVGYLRFNPSSACTLPRIVKKEIIPLDEVQSKAFLAAIKEHRFEIIFTVTLFTGMRESEIMGLMWDCVDFTKGIIRIDKQLQQEKKIGGQYIFAPLKNDKARTITPAPWVMKLLRTHRARQAEMRLQAGEAWNDTGLVFTNEFGCHLARCTLVNGFKKVVASIGCPNTRFHDLRHSYAVSAIRSGDDIKTVQGNLGHATAAFTLDVYGHVTDQMKTASAARMEGYIKDVLGL